MKYKIIVIGFILLGISFNSIAQEHEYETIFSRRASRHKSNFRGYGEILNSYNPLFKNKKAYHLLGGGIELGVTYKKKHSLGFGFTSIGNIPDGFKSGSIDLNTTNKAVECGLSYSYRPNPQKAIHLSYNLFMGSLHLSELTLKDDQEFDVSKAVGFFVNPNVKLEANLMSWVSINFGAGYRITGGKEAFGINVTQDLRGSVFSFGLKFQKLR